MKEVTRGNHKEGKIHRSNQWPWPSQRNITFSISWKNKTVLLTEIKQKVTRDYNKEEGLRRSNQWPSRDALKGTLQFWSLKWKFRLPHTEKERVTRIVTRLAYPWPWPSKRKYVLFISRRNVNSNIEKYTTRNNNRKCSWTFSTRAAALATGHYFLLRIEKSMQWPWQHTFIFQLT